MSPFVVIRRERFPLALVLGLAAIAVVAATAMCDRDTIVPRVSSLSPIHAGGKIFALATVRWSGYECCTDEGDEYDVLDVVAPRRGDPRSVMVGGSDRWLDKHATYIVEIDPTAWDRGNDLRYGIVEYGCLAPTTSDACAMPPTDAYASHVFSATGLPISR